MGKRCVYGVSLVVAFLVLSGLADRGAAQRIATGSIREIEPGRSIVLSRFDSDVAGLSITFRSTTVFEGSPDRLKPGVRVSVWYRLVSGRRPVADKVRVPAGSS